MGLFLLYPLYPAISFSHPSHKNDSISKLIRYMISICRIHFAGLLHTFRANIVRKVYERCTKRVRKVCDLSFSFAWNLLGFSSYSANDVFWFYRSI
jgi:hypothetical protein